MAKLRSLKKQIAKSKAKSQAAARADRIQYLTDLFHLSFRTHSVYDATVEYDEANGETSYEEALYDYQTDFASDAVAGFGEDDSEMESFRADFAALGAEHKFRDLCREYYQDQLDELKAKSVTYAHFLALYQQDDPEELAKMNPASRRRYEDQYRSLLDKIELNRKYQAIMHKKLQNYSNHKTTNVSEEPDNEI